MNSSEKYLGLSFLSFVMGFRELSDGEWEVIRPLLPPRAGVGRPRIDDRLIINGILYVLVTGCRWMDLGLEPGPARLPGIRLFLLLTGMLVLISLLLRYALTSLVSYAEGRGVGGPTGST